MRISDWSSDVCSSDLLVRVVVPGPDFAVDAQLADATRDQLRVLRAEVEDEDFVGMEPGFGIGDSGFGNARHTSSQHLCCLVQSRLPNPESRAPASAGAVVRRFLRYLPVMNVALDLRSDARRSGKELCQSVCICRSTEQS